MLRPRHLVVTAILILAALLCASMLLAFQREGLLPWLGVLLAALGLASCRLLSPKKALLCATTLTLLVVFSWAGAVFFVYSQWESGEVVQIQLADEHFIRTWLVNNGSHEMLIYDAPPKHQALVESGGPMSMTFRGESFLATLRAVPVTFDSPELIEVYNLYLANYAKQSRATDIYYLLIGPRRGSQLYVLYLERTPGDIMP